MKMCTLLLKCNFQWALCFVCVLCVFCVCFVYVLCVFCVSFVCVLCKFCVVCMFCVSFVCVFLCVLSMFCACFVRILESRESKYGKYGIVECLKVLGPTCSAAVFRSCSQRSRRLQSCSLFRPF